MSFVWRKLLSNPPPDWQRLPLLTRGVGNEILRALDAEGEIECGTEDPMAVVCRVTAAHPKERRRVREAVEELVAEGWLTIDVVGGRSVIRGHLPDLATRKRKATPRAPETPPTGTDGARSVSGTCAEDARSVRGEGPERALSVPGNAPNSAESLNTGPVEEKREEEKREEEITPTPTPPLVLVPDEPESEAPAPVREVFDYWCSVMSKTAATKLDRVRRRRIEWAIKHYGVVAAKQAIDGCARTDFNMGREPGKPAKHNDVELIFRTASNFERFRDAGQRPMSGRVEPLPNSAYRQKTDEEFQRELEEAFGPVSDEDLARTNRGVRFGHG